jgi:hypothetical protein
VDRQLIDYLPQILKEVRELKAIVDAEQPEASDLWDALDDALNDQFVQDASENGVSRWEKILKIVPQPSRTLAERKFLILARLNEELPYTLNKLKQQLETLCGVDNYSVILNHTAYTLTVEVALIASNSLNDVDSLVQRSAPANLIINVTLKYNKHSTLANFTHYELAAYTYYQLRNGVIS